MRIGAKWTDKQIELNVGALLRWGVLASAAIVLCGGAIFLVRHGADPTDYRVFHGTPPEMRHVGGIVRGALSRSGRALVQLGLLLLIATPVARVALSLAGFALERDRIYVVVTAVVLAILLCSLLGGAIERGTSVARAPCRTTGGVCFVATLGAESVRPEAQARAPGSGTAVRMAAVLF